MSYGRLRDHIEKLNIFVEVARAQSFHKAARNLGLSQPSLSQAVKILEDILDRKLFVRSRKGVDLTPSGTKLLIFSERLISEVEGIEGRICFPNQTMAGTVAIGIFSSLATYVLPRFLVHMTKKHPELKVKVITLRADELASALTSRRCHIVVGTGRFEQKTVTQFDLYEDYFGFFVGKKLKGTPNKVPLIYVGRAQDDEGNTLDSLFKNVEEGRRFDLEAFETVHAMILEGLGVGILPLRIAEREVTAGRFFSTSVAKHGKYFGKHKFYCSVLNEDFQNDRTMEVLKELQEWCSN
jgi:DNA-binding transcriptional LysR family regulator